MSEEMSRSDTNTISISVSKTCGLAFQQMNDILRIHKDVTNLMQEKRVERLQLEVDGLKSENESLKHECNTLKASAEILELELQRCRSVMDAMQSSNDSSKRRDQTSVMTTAKQTRESLARVDNACKNIERRKELEDNYAQVVNRKDREIAELKEKLSRYKIEKQKVAQELDIVLKQRQFISEQLVMANTGDGVDNESRCIDHDRL
eukprot:759371-Hanusia_phi.AAC.1